MTSEWWGHQRAPEGTTEGSSHLVFANTCFGFAFQKREHKVKTEKNEVAWDWCRQEDLVQVFANARSFS
jgi:hypothetical protein